jgi:hypothetical protein
MIIFEPKIAESRPAVTREKNIFAATAAMNAQ